MGMSYEELRKIPREELIEIFDKTAKYSCEGIAYYREEIARRDAEELNKLMMKHTCAITIMTVIMTVATIVQLFLYFCK